MDINALITKWQTQILLIGTGKISPDDAKDVINNIIDEIVDNKEYVINGEINVANHILLFSNVLLYGGQYDADVAKLSFLAL